MESRVATTVGFSDGDAMKRELVVLWEAADHPAGDYKLNIITGPGGFTDTVHNGALTTSSALDTRQKTTERAAEESWSVYSDLLVAMFDRLRLATLGAIDETALDTIAMPNNAFMSILKHNPIATSGANDFMAKKCIDHFLEVETMRSAGRLQAARWAPPGRWVTSARLAQSDVVVDPDNIPSWEHTMHHASLAEHLDEVHAVLQLAEAILFAKPMCSAASTCGGLKGSPGALLWHALTAPSGGRSALGMLEQAHCTTAPFGSADTTGFAAAIFAQIKGGKTMLALADMILQAESLELETISFGANYIGGEEKKLTGWGVGVASTAIEEALQLAVATIYSMDWADADSAASSTAVSREVAAALLAAPQLQGVVVTLASKAVGQYDTQPYPAFTQEHRPRVHGSSVQLSNLIPKTGSRCIIRIELDPAFYSTADPEWDPEKKYQVNMYAPLEYAESAVATANTSFIQLLDTLCRGAEHTISRSLTAMDAMDVPAQRWGAEVLLDVANNADLIDRLNRVSQLIDAAEGPKASRSATWGNPNPANPTLWNSNRFYRPAGANGVAGSNAVFTATVSGVFVGVTAGKAIVQRHDGKYAYDLSVVYLRLPTDETLKVCRPHHDAASDVPWRLTAADLGKPNLATGLEVAVLTTAKGTKQQATAHLQYLPVTIDRMPKKNSTEWPCAAANDPKQTGMARPAAYGEGYDVCWDASRYVTYNARPDQLLVAGPGTELIPKVTTVRVKIESEGSRWDWKMVQVATFDDVGLYVGYLKPENNVLLFEITHETRYNPADNPSFKKVTTWSDPAASRKSTLDPNGTNVFWLAIKDFTWPGRLPSVVPITKRLHGDMLKADAKNRLVSRQSSLTIEDVADAELPFDSSRVPQRSVKVRVAVHPHPEYKGGTDTQPVYFTWLAEERDNGEINCVPKESDLARRVRNISRQMGVCLPGADTVVSLSRPYEGLPACLRIPDLVLQVCWGYVAPRKLLTFFDRPFVLDRPDLNNDTDVVAFAKLVQSLVAETTEAPDLVRRYVQSCVPRMDNDEALGCDFLYVLFLWRNRAVVAAEAVSSAQDLVDHWTNESSGSTIDGWNIETEAHTLRVMYAGALLEYPVHLPTDLQVDPATVRSKRIQRMHFMKPLIDILQRGGHQCLEGKFDTKMRALCRTLGNLDELFVANTVRDVVIIKQHGRYDSGIQPIAFGYRIKQVAVAEQVPNYPVGGMDDFDKDANAGHFLDNTTNTLYQKVNGAWVYEGGMPQAMRYEYSTNNSNGPYTEDTFAEAVHRQLQDVAPQAAKVYLYKKGTVPGQHDVRLDRDGWVNLPTGWEAEDDHIRDLTHNAAAGPLILMVVANQNNGWGSPGVRVANNSPLRVETTTDLMVRIPNTVTWSRSAMIDELNGLLMARPVRVPNSTDLVVPSEHAPVGNAEVEHWMTQMAYNRTHAARYRSPLAGTTKITVQVHPPRYTVRATDARTLATLTKALSVGNETLVVEGFAAPQLHSVDRKHVWDVNPYGFVTEIQQSRTNSEYVATAARAVVARRVADAFMGWHYARSTEPRQTAHALLSGPACATVETAVKAAGGTTVTAKHTYNFLVILQRMAKSLVSDFGILVKGPGRNAAATPCRLPAVKVLTPAGQRVMDELKGKVLQAAQQMPQVRVRKHPNTLVHMLRDGALFDWRALVASHPDLHYPMARVATELELCDTVRADAGKRYHHSLPVRAGQLALRCALVDLLVCSTG